MGDSEATTTAAPTGQPTTIPQLAAQRRFVEKPYLQCLESLENSFPALKLFLEKLANEDPGREVVKAHYQREHQRGPGRCYCLKFEKSSVSIVKENGFESPAALRKYLEDNPAKKSREVEKHRRLFILEDMEPDYVDALGHHLGVDPLVFSEHMNTWNFTSSWSIPHRDLPSMSVPERSFTLRYYELRTLSEPRSIDILSMQMTFAVNRRRYERWRDIDVPSAGEPDRRHAFVRRCASFWTSQHQTPKVENPTKKEDDPSNDAPGWDAVILVDPAFAATCKPPQAATSNTTRVAPVAVGHTPPAATMNIPLAKPSNGTPTTTNKTIPATAIMNDGLEQCLILKDPRKYFDRASLWKAQDWGTSQTLEKTNHESWPYHNGCSTLAPLTFSQVGIGAQEAHIKKFQDKRDLVSPLDEMVFCWTKLATPELIKQTNTKSSNAAYYLLKHTAQHWIHQLELINTTITKAEWFSDDYQARIDDNLSLQKWKTDLIKVTKIAKDINYMRRHLNHFWRSMVLNLERLGVQLGNEGIDDTASLALKGAQKDFLTIHTRMQPLRDRAEALNSVSNDLANLRAAFRGVYDSEFGLRLSLFASIVFPLTLVASIFSMGDDYQPGRSQFWKLWAIGPPFCVALALGLVYGMQPWRIFYDLGEYLERHGFIGSKVEKAAYKPKKEKKERDKMEKMTKKEQKGDEEQGGGDNKDRRQD